MVLPALAVVGAIGVVTHGSGYLLPAILFIIVPTLPLIRDPRGRRQVRRQGVRWWLTTRP
jgi:hypothetical protein